MAHYHRGRILGFGLAATMIFSIIATSAVPTPALADAVGDKKAQAAALAEQINADAVQVQVLDSQYDGAQYHLAQVNQQLATAKHQLQVAQTNADHSRAALASEAVVAYMHGGTTAPAVSNRSASVDLSVQAGYFQLAVGNQADALDRFRTSEQTLRAQQIDLNNAQANSQAAVSQVASREQAVKAASATSQAALNQVQGQLVQLVAQQQAAIQQQQEAQVKAALLAAQTKAAQAVAAAQAKVDRSTSSNGAAGSKGGSSSSGGSRNAPTSTTKSPAPSVPVGPILASSPGAATAIAFARAQIGKPYAWGGSGPGSYDCSGLTMRAWGAAGVSLPHFSGAQYADTAHVPIADLQPGDLVFYGSDIHHVGLYIGNGQMIDAPYTGAFVRVDSIYWSDLQPYGGRP